MPGKILLIGLGELGYHILTQLSLTKNVGKIVAADVKDEAKIKAIIARNTAFHRGLYPEIEFIKIDLFDVKGTAETLKEIKPDVICNATVLQSWWVFHLLPEKIVEKLNDAGLGPQLPFHLTLTYKLMQAVKLSGIETRVINCSYSDVVDPVLGKVGLAPVCGGGNMDLVVPLIKELVSKETGTPVQNVSVYMFGHHGLLSSFMHAPFLVKIYVYDKDVTDRFPHDKIREYCQPYLKALMSGGTRWRVPPNEDIAASFTRNLLAVYFDTKELCHAQGPAGLPGGYPVRLSARGAEVVLPEGVTIDEAVRINEECGRYDGIEKIKDDGTVVFTEKAVKVYREVLGYECEELKIEESEERAKELAGLFKKLLEKCGIHY